MKSLNVVNIFTPECGFVLLFPFLVFEIRWNVTKHLQARVFENFKLLWAEVTQYVINKMLIKNKT